MGPRGAGEVRGAKHSEGNGTRCQDGAFAMRCDGGDAERTGEPVTLTSRNEPPESQTTSGTEEGACR